MTTVDVYEVLGGRRALGVPQPELSDLRHLLEAGLPFPALESVRDTLGLSRTEILASLGITARTLARRKRDQRLDPAESDRLFRLARITALALEILEDPDSVRRWPTPVLLFRYSALTMNSHRIHYDQPYVTGTEGYPGLVVHGPLTATLLLDLFRREMPRATLAESSIRAAGPLFHTGDFTVEGEPDSGAAAAKLWALDPSGSLAMAAEVKYQA